MRRFAVAGFMLAASVMLGQGALAQSTMFTSGASPDISPWPSSAVIVEDWPTGRGVMDGLTADFGYPWIETEAGAMAVETLEEAAAMLQQRPASTVDGLLIVAQPVDGPASVSLIYGVLGEGERHALRLLDVFAPDLQPWFLDAVATGLAWETDYEDESLIPGGTATMFVSRDAGLITLSIVPDPEQP